MDWESIKALFWEYLPTIINYGLTLIAYIIVLIFRSRTKKTSNTLRAVFDERSELAEKRVAAAIAKADEARAYYENAAKDLDDLRKTYEKRLVTLENTIKIMLEVEENGETGREQNGELRSDGNDRASAPDDTRIERGTAQVQSGGQALTDQSVQ